MKWDKKEIAYQHVHMFYGFWLSYLMYSLTGWHVMASLGAWLGLLVEWYQYMYTDNRQLYLGDRARDWLFWTSGGLFILLVI